MKVEEGPSNTLLLSIRLRYLDKKDFFELAPIDAPMGYWQVTQVDPEWFDVANPTQWAAGEAFCLACSHRWAMAAQTGLTVFECPSCHRETGHWKFEFHPAVGQKVRSCGGCENQLFYLTPDGHMCANCGVYQSY